MININKTRKHAALLLSAAVLLLIGCNGPQTADEVRSQTKLYIDEYSKYQSINAPSLFKHHNGGSTYALLRQSGSQPQLYITWSSNQWAFIKSAYNSQGEKLKLITIDRGIVANLGMVEEHYAINYSIEQLKKAAQNDGLDVKFFGKDHDAVVQLPAWYIQGFLQALDDLEKNGQG